MELWHEPVSSDSTRLADRVDVAEHWVAKARGRMFTRRFPEGSALVFPFDTAERRSIHMVGVPYHLDVVYLVEEEVTKVVTLRPLIGVSWGRADRIVELPAGTADDVDVGDRLVLRDA